MLRERLDACRKSEAKATALAKTANERIAAALASRGALAAEIYKAAQASSHTCPATRVGFEQQVIKWAERYRDDLERRRTYFD